MSTASNTADLLDDIFTDEDFEGYAETASKEGEGLDRDYELTIENAYFKEASAEYQAAVKKGEGKVLQIVFEGVNGKGDQRKETYTIGKGWVLQNADGKTAKRVQSEAGYTQFSATSLYGRIYRDLGLWGIPGWEGNFKEEDGRPDFTIELKETDAQGNPKQIVVGPQLRKMIKNCKEKFGGKIDPRNAEIWNGVTLKMAKEEWEDKGSKKVKDRAFPVGVLSIAGSAPATNGATNGSAVAPKAPAAAPVSAPADSSEVKDDLEILIDLRAKAEGSDHASFQKWAMTFIKTSAEESKRKKWMTHVIDKKNFELFKAGEGDVPNF